MTVGPFRPSKFPALLSQLHSPVGVVLSLAGKAMRRRDFIAGVAGSTAAWPLSAHAQAQTPQDGSEVQLNRTLRLQVDVVADRIDQFIEGIRKQVDAMAQPPWTAAGAFEQRNFAILQLLRGVPAILAIAQLDGAGKERSRVSRVRMDAAGVGSDFSKDPKFTEAVAKGVRYGPVYFRDGASEPYMTLSVAGPRPYSGVNVAEVNLKPVQDVVIAAKIGERGLAYVIDAENRVIAHPNTGLIQQDFSRLDHVRAARAAGSRLEGLQTAHDSNGREVIAICAPISRLGWLVFAELPVEEAKASSR
jgi:hypothetical protein